MFEIDTSRGLCTSIATAVDAADCLSRHLSAHRAAGPITFLVRRREDGLWASCTIDAAHGPEAGFHGFLEVQLDRVFDYLTELPEETSDGRAPNR